MCAKAHRAVIAAFSSPTRAPMSLWGRPRTGPPIMRGDPVGHRTCRAKTRPADPPAAHRLAERAAAPIGAALPPRQLQGPARPGPEAAQATIGLVLSRRSLPIVAIATAPGRGAVGIVRASGPDLQPLMHGRCAAAR